MNTGKKYNTKQKSIILQCIYENANSYITIMQLNQKLKEKGAKVGLTTIYRTLDKLEKENIIAKVSIDGINGTCYRYLNNSNQDALFYMKCEKCGELVHIDCPQLDHLYKHIYKDHEILINPGRTMFYGKCEKCLNK